MASASARPTIDTRTRVTEPRGYAKDPVFSRDLRVEDPILVKHLVVKVTKVLYLRELVESSLNELIVIIVLAGQLDKRLPQFLLADLTCFSLALGLALGLALALLLASLTDELRRQEKELLFTVEALVRLALELEDEVAIDGCVGRALAGLIGPLHHDVASIGVENCTEEPGVVRVPVELVTTLDDDVVLCLPALADGVQDASLPVLVITIAFKNEDENFAVTIRCVVVERLVGDGDFYRSIRTWQCATFCGFPLVLTQG